MDKIDKNGTTIFLFILILLIIIGGGIYLIKNNNKSKDNKEFKNNNEKKIINKVNKDKDYIYFINEDILSEEEELIFKDIVINIESEDAKKVETDLNNRIKKYKDDIEKEDEEIIDMTSIDYETTISKKYLSLIARTYKYTNSEEKENIDNDYYVFDLYSGKLLDNDTIIKKESIDENKIKEKIKEYIKGDEDININKTLNNDYYLTIGKNGKVNINFVVNSNDINYNVSIEMD